MSIQFSSATPSSLPVDLLVVGVRPGALDDALSAAGLGAGVAEAARTEDFTGKSGSGAVWPAFGAAGARRVALVGLGDGGADAVRRAGGWVGSQARALGAADVALVLPGVSGDGLGATLEAVLVGNYRFDKYKAADARKKPLATLTVCGAAEPAVADRAEKRAAAQAFARDLVNEPAAEIYPESLAAIAASLAGDGMEVEIWDEKRIRDAGMGGITAVGQGSDRPARFIHLKWVPAGATRSVGLVGKGVTFDSGGLSIKPSDGMQTMRCDMSGAAAVLGVMHAVKSLRAPVAVHGIIGAVENMPSGNSYKLGDVLRMYNGKTVEIHNTDAEGRLVLADCLTYADRLGLDGVVDIATLTGAAVVALGDQYSALYASDAALGEALRGLAADAGEYVWPMPLPDFYKDLLKAEWADLKNVGGRAAGSITAALFLKEFVEKTPWAHVDIAGPAFYDRPWRHYAAGGTGAMVPTLLRWAGV